MRRRDFITLLGGAAAWPLAARAQQIERVRRVGVLLGIAESEFRARFEPFRDELARLGWSEPRNLRIDSRWTDNKPDLANARARELVGLAPEVIYAAPGPAAEVLQPLTRTIPIVFSTSTDPVEAGYVQSYARPGGNMTGFTQFEASINTKYVQLLRDIAPNVTRVAILRSDDLARGRRDFALVAEAARSLGLTPVDLLVRDDPADFTSAIGMFAREQGGGLIVPPNNIYLQHRALIVALADQYRLPTVYNFRLFVEAGGLMSYGPDPIDNYRRPAMYVDRILRGAKPADLPVQAPTKYQLFINLKTAKALGLAISHEFLLTVDEVIE
jgi:putative tryptophan/tyrosine transport system substrate-binding protein